MNLQQFWELRESESGSPKISSDIIKYFFDNLAIQFGVPLQTYQEKIASRGLHTRWRIPTAQAGVLKLGLEGSFSIILGQNSPRVRASVFLFSGEHKLFPQEANQGYFYMQYIPEKGWEIVQWYMDEFEEFLERKYSGEVLSYRPINISPESEERIYDSILHQILKSPINISLGESLSFYSEEPLFGILEIEFAGKLKSVSSNPQTMEMTVWFNTKGNRLTVGQINKWEKVLYLTSSNGMVWDYKWGD